jgi:hypothetical protein
MGVGEGLGASSSVILYDPSTQKMKKFIAWTLEAEVVLRLYALGQLVRVLFFHGR